MEEAEFVMDIDMCVIQVQRRFVNEDIFQNWQHAFSIEIMLQIHSLGER